MGPAVYRFSDLDFEANAKEGVAIDWPIRYADISPWYDYAERFAGISGSLEGLPHLPDGQFLPPMEMNCLEKDVKRRIASSFGGRPMIIGRAANLTQPHNGPRLLPISQPLHARLSLRSLFQQQRRDAAGRVCDREPDAAALLHRE